MTYGDRENFENLFALCAAIGIVGVGVFLVICLGPEKTLAVITVAALAGAYWAHKKLEG